MNFAPKQRLFLVPPQEPGSKFSSGVVVGWVVLFNELGTFGAAALKDHQFYFFDRLQAPIAQVVL